MKTAVIAALAGLGVLASAATAQAGNSLGGSALSADLGLQKVVTLLQDFDIQTEIKPSSAGAKAPAVMATTPGGAKFLVGLFQCQDPQNGGGCRQVLLSTAQPSAGVSFDEINQFNGVASVTTVYYEPSAQILIFGRNLFLQGGVSDENFKLHVALFLQDMQSYVNSRSGAGAATIAFNNPPTLSSKIDSQTGTDPSGAVRLTADQFRDEVEMAINNAGLAAFVVNDEAR